MTANPKLACNAFGGREAVATRIAEVIATVPEASAFFGVQISADNAVEALQGIARAKVARFLFLNDISSNQIFPTCDLAEDSEHWTQQMLESAADTMIGDSGKSPPKNLALRIFLQQRALEEVCGPTPDPTDQEARKLRDYRERYRSAVSP